MIVWVPTRRATRRLRSAVRPFIVHGHCVGLTTPASLEAHPARWASLVLQRFTPWR